MPPPSGVHVTTCVFRSTGRPPRQLLFASAMSRPIAAVAIALQLLALHAAAARPPRQPAATATSSLALAPAVQRRGAAEDAAVREGKWLPFAAHHFPGAAFWAAHRPVPWMGFGAGEEEGDRALDRELERERPYAGGDAAGHAADTTQQEQLALWASLLNPKRRKGTAAGWRLVPGVGQAADDEPAKDTAEGTDRAAGGGQDGLVVEPGLSWGNNGN